VEVLAPLSGSEVDRAFEERRTAHPRAGRVRSPAQAELPGREGPPATFAWWTRGRLGDPAAKTDRVAGELDFPRARPSRMARFLLDSRRTHRFEILGASVLGGYHLFVLPLLCGALALWTPWAPLPAIAATLGTGLPWLLHEFRPLLEGGEGLASERQRSPSSARRT
jgi:hypothetical protein